MLLKLNCVASNLDKAVFRWYHKGDLQGAILLHVDDFLFCGIKLFQKEVTENAVVAFEVGMRKCDAFKYVGLNVQRKANGIVMHQDEYVNELQEIDVMALQCETNEHKTTQEELKLLREISGQVLWVSSQTRHDLSFDSLELSVARNNATIGTLKRCAKVMRKAKEKSSQILFRPIGESCVLHVYADASFCNLPDGVSSTQGFIILLVGNKDRCIIAWGSSKIKRKVACTLEAETLALKEALNNALYLGSLITEFMFNDFQQNKVPIIGFIDNKPTEQSIRSTKQVKEKRLRIDTGKIQRMLSEGEVKDVKWVPTNEQIADGLTKRDVLSIRAYEW